MYIIDSHIHLDMYEVEEQEAIIRQMDDYSIQALISVSKDFKSAKENLSLSAKDHRIKVAIGLHPEQILPSRKQIEKIFNLIEDRKEELVAIGEVGLPYYLRQKDKDMNTAPYIELLESFIILAKRIHKPIVFHAIYEDAEIACDLLEKHQVDRAHFHWFKGGQHTLNRMIKNGYVISITPDIYYEAEIQEIVKQTPLEQMLVETDGPWAFKERFSNQRTHPKMIHETIKKIAQIKRIDLETTYRKIYENTKNFYNLSP